MPLYSNFSGRSGVESYDLGDRSISVTFKNGRNYSYNHDTVGKEHVDAMTELAESGVGLCTYIGSKLNPDRRANWWSSKSKTKPKRHWWSRRR